MQLYITPTSPYARITRIVVLEKRLEERVEILPAETRVAGSPYYRINPSGRVPFLVCDDGDTLEDSGLICRYLDRLDGAPTLEPQDPEAVWATARLESLARSMLDGLAVWARELHRPESERSPGIIDHERERSRRMADLWERRIADPWMRGELNHAQLALIVTLDLDVRLDGFRWRDGHPALRAWVERLASRASVAATRFVS